MASAPKAALAAALLLSVSASVARAQGRERSSILPGDKPHVVTSDSVERLNPISPLIARRDRIGIPDSLIAPLARILSRLDAKNARAMQQIDSLAATASATPGAAPSSQRNLPGAGISLDVLFGEIGRNNDSASAEALKLLSGKVADRARDAMNDQKKKLNKLLSDSRPAVRGG